MSTTAQGQAVGNHGVGDAATHKRPWEELPPEQERPGHISRAQMHFDKHIIDRNEPRANYPGWAERPTKKRRNTKSHHQEARDHQSMSHARSHHEYHSNRPISYGPPAVPSMYDPSKPGPSIHTPEGRTYTPAGWRQQGGEFDKYAKNLEPLTLDVDETPPPVGWTERPRDYNLLPIGRESSSQGDGNSQSSLSPQAPQRPPYHPSQHPQPYLSQINERPPPPQQQQSPQQYQQPPPRQESTGPPPPPSNYQPPQQPASYQQPPQRPIESGEAVRHQQDWSEYRREDSRERIGPSESESRGWGPPPAPPPSYQPSYDQRSVERPQEPARYQAQQQPQQQQPPPPQQHQPEYRPAPRPASPTRFREPELQQQQAQQVQQAPLPQQYHAHPHSHAQAPTQLHPRMTISAAKCPKCDDSGKPLRTFKDQLDDISTVFGNFGDYQDIHEEYTSRGYSHDDVPGLKEFHRICELVREASVLTTYMVGVAPVVKRMLKAQKGGDEGKVRSGEGEMFQLVREMDERLSELAAAAASSSYGSESSRRTADTSPQYSNMPPPPPPQQQQQQQQPSPVPSQNERQQSMQLAHHPQSPAPSASSQIEPASTRRSTTFNASLASQNPTNNPNVPTFAIESSDPTLEAKLTKLKARLETEISEVDNLTEEKKRLEERIKELEAMVEEERERRRGEVDMGMKDRTSFLSVLEGVVALGRREGDSIIKCEPGILSSSGNSGSGDDGGDKSDNVVEEVGDLATLRRELEKLRERNRVCESALEHIKRETRHMEETGRKVEESRRGIDLVLGRVLTGHENPLPGDVSLIEGAVVPPAPPALEASAPGLAIAAPAVVEAAPAVPIVPRALTPVVESQPTKEVVEVKE